MTKSFTLDAIAAHIGAKLILKEGVAVADVSGVNTLEEAGSEHVSFLSSPKYAKQLPETNAQAVMVSEEFVNDVPCHALLMRDPYLGFAKVATLFDETPVLAAEVAPSAVVDPSAEIGDNARIAANVVVAKGVKIGADCQIHPGCVIGENVVIGDGAVLYPNVTVYHGVTIGARCIIHSSSVIGSDGFGLANDQGRWMKIPQLGAVVIEDDVEIGACTTIDRGALKDTRICQGAKLDNQIQIGHNVTIGAHTAMAGGTVVAGSTTIGKYCMIGGQSAIGGHIEICDQFVMTGSSAIGKSVTEPDVYSCSIPAQPRSKWYRTLASWNRIDKLFKRLKVLEEKVNGSE